MSDSTDNMTKAVQSVTNRIWHTFFPQAAVAQADDLCKLKDTVAPGIEIFVPRGHKVKNLSSPMLEVAVDGRRYFAVFRRFVVNIHGLQGSWFNETVISESLLKALQGKVGATGANKHSCMWVMSPPYMFVSEGEISGQLDTMGSIAIAAFDIVPMTKWEKRRAAIGHWFRGLAHA